MRQRTVSPLRMMRQRKRKSTKLTIRTTAAAATTTVTTTTTKINEVYYNNSSKKQNARARNSTQLNPTKLVPRCSASAVTKRSTIENSPQSGVGKREQQAQYSLTLYERNKIAVVMRFLFFSFFFFLYLKKHISHPYKKPYYYYPCD